MASIGTATAEVHLFLFHLLSKSFAGENLLFCSHSDTLNWHAGRDVPYVNLYQNIGLDWLSPWLQLRRKQLISTSPLDQLLWGLTHMKSYITSMKKVFFTFTGTEMLQHQLWKMYVKTFQ